ncbi:MAG: hypothetical protein WC861_05165, partial [Candidatus Micrarchaeia archaeon]
MGRRNLLFQFNPILLALGLLTIPSLVNITFFDGLSQDFSNLVVLADSGSSQYAANFSLVSVESGSYAIANVSAGEGDTLGFFASNLEGNPYAGEQGGSDSPPDNASNATIPPEQNQSSPDNATISSGEGQLPGATPN